MVKEKRGGWHRVQGAIGCLLMRDSETGEHISNENNELQYIPFPICNETGKPLELAYGVEDGISPSSRQSNVQPKAKC